MRDPYDVLLFEELRRDVRMRLLILPGLSAMLGSALIALGVQHAAEPSAAIVGFNVDMKTVALAATGAGMAAGAFVAGFRRLVPLIKDAQRESMEPIREQLLGREGDEEAKTLRTFVDERTQRLEDRIDRYHAGLDERHTGLERRVAEVERRQWREHEHHGKASD